MFFDAFAGLGLGLSLYEGITGASENREMARAEMKNIQKQMNLINQHKTELSDQYNQTRGNISDMYGNKITSLFDKVSSSIYDINEQERSAISKGGFAVQGDISRRTEISKNSLNKSYKTSQKTLFDELTSSFDDLKNRENEELYQADLQLTNLQGQYDIAKEQSNDYFLGIF